MKKIIPTLVTLTVAGILVSCGAKAPEQIPLSPKTPTPVTDVAPVAPVVPDVTPDTAAENNVSTDGTMVTASGVTAPGVVANQNSVSADGTMMTATGVMVAPVPMPGTTAPMAPTQDAGSTSSN